MNDKRESNLETVRDNAFQDILMMVHKYKTLKYPFGMKLTTIQARTGAAISIDTRTDSCTCVLTTLERKTFCNKHNGTDVMRKLKKNNIFLFAKLFQDFYVVSC